MVEWTKTAYTKIKEKAYRYFSPEFLDEWEHPETKTKFKDVLFGGGITNRPFLKNLVPINMTEFVNSSGGTSMDPAEVLKQLAKMFGLPEDTDPGVVLGYVQAKMGEKPDEEEEKPDSGSDSGGGGNPPPGQQQAGPPQTKAADEGQQGKGKEGEGTNGTALDESALMNLPFVKTLMDTVTGQGKKLDEQEVEKSIVMLSEKAAAKGKAIPPVIKDGLKKQLSEIPPTARPALVKLFETMVDEGQVGVELGERGGAGGHGGSKTAQETINAAVTKKMSEDSKLTYADAVDMVARENPQMYVDYQRELANA
jgi:phage I-like protein